MVALSAEDKNKVKYESRMNCEHDIIGSFLITKSIKEGVKRDLQISDFRHLETRQAYTDMLQGLFYNLEEASELYKSMVICRGADSNVGVKINYLIKNAN